MIKRLLISSVEFERMRAYYSVCIGGWVGCFLDHVYPLGMQTEQ
uniref:Uncharacterized protein n=1 Tax=Rhizophora mucronata TaxID=61149 RepID=A0A2P2NVM7_RHIMU